MKLMVQTVVLERLCRGRGTSMDLGDGGFGYIAMSEL